MVNYTGRPGIHHDGDGTTEGWFRSPDGGFVTTEPVGSEDWMPLNDFPTAKPTYDFYDTVAAGRTAIANGELVSTTPNPADAQFPDGSVTWHWTSVAPIANYLVEDSVGYYTLSQRLGSDGIMYYEAQDTSISAKQQKRNLAIMNQQQSITDFEAQFSGPYPFVSDGVVVGTPPASFEEEMQTMITFASGKIGKGTFYHENMHQWWGDHVTEASYSMTFYKEGLATLGEYLGFARQAERRAGGPNTAAGKAAFQAQLVAFFNASYGTGAAFWDEAPSDPTPATLFKSPPTYERPGAAYIALRQILGASNFESVLAQVQKTYGGGNIDEAQLEAAFHQGMPNQSAAPQSEARPVLHPMVRHRLPQGGGTNRPQITGPGLNGTRLLQQERRLQLTTGCVTGGRRPSPLRPGMCGGTQIHGGHRTEPVAGLLQQGRVATQAGGITADQNHALRPRGRHQLDRLRAEPDATGIGHRQIGALRGPGGDIGPDHPGR